MKLFSLQQAITLSRASQFLVGMPFDQDFPEATEILCITPCPSRDEARNKFLDDYDCFGSTDLTEYIDEDAFDVVVIARNRPDKEVCLTVNLKTFLYNNKLRMVA